MYACALTFAQALQFTRVQFQSCPQRSLQRTGSPQVQFVGLQDLTLPPLQQVSKCVDYIHTLEQNKSLNVRRQLLIDIGTCLLCALSLLSILTHCSLFIHMWVFRDTLSYSAMRVCVCVCVHACVCVCVCVCVCACVCM